MKGGTPSYLFRSAHFIFVREKNGENAAAGLKSDQEETRSPSSLLLALLYRRRSLPHHLFPIIDRQSGDTLPPGLS